MARLASLIIALALTVSAAASAADATDGDITLDINAGAAMTSLGGDFVPAKNGQVVVEDERLQVLKGFTAILRYPNGCMRKYSPGNYVVEKDCVIDKVGPGWITFARTAFGVMVGGLVLDAIEDHPVSK